MSQLHAQDLYSLEHYARIRGEFRARVIEHKARRRVALGPNAALYFEDRLTMQYQVQEMLRIERIFEPEGIAEELEVYNPLIPDGSNWKATFMVEFGDEAERRVALTRLIGIEDLVWLRVGELPEVRPFADEDMARSTPDKTAAVHFLRFELTPEHVAALRGGAPLRAGVSHPCYRADVMVPDVTRQSLLEDLA